jgi:putative endonuclease
MKAAVAALFMAWVYILYSSDIDAFYVGYTVDLTSRLIQHNTGFYSGSFTSRAKDWQVYLEIPCETVGEAIFIERYIKKMKSRKYIEDLRKYPEIVDTIKAKYQ